MASSILPLLPALFFSLLLLMTLPCHCIVDPTSTTLAISQATSSVCGITTGSQHRRIQCTRFSESVNLTSSFPIYPTISFDSISGGHNFICSLTSSDSSFFCWNGIGQRIKRIYPGPTVLSELSVGARHVAAIDGDRRNIRWWRYGCNRHVQRCGLFPKSVSGEYHSLTSGDDFTCALNGTNSVQCWGPSAKQIQRSFAGVNMTTLTAGGSRMCGLNETGNLICVGDQSNLPSVEAFEFTSLAIGSSHTCAITRINGTVVCWGQHGSYFPAGSARFEFLVAGGDLTCGLTSDSYNVACWGLNERNSSAVILSLPKILPGVCVLNENLCSCGVYPDSGDLCGGQGVICKKSDIGTTESCQVLRIIERVKIKKLSNWLVYAVVGGAFGVFCIGILLGVGVGYKLMKDKATDQHERDLLSPRTAPAITIPGVENVQSFTFKEIKKVTNKFHKKLGVGGYGKVYQGKLPNNRLVAVKRIVARTDADTEAAFRAELETQSKAHHENVVELIGYCIENNQRFLVFEFMSQGDLDAHLFPGILKRKSRLFYSWRLRVKVLLDVAKAIEYLHVHTDRRIIHRDIKSSNILIDEDWVAKLSDFGLALFGPARGASYVNIQTPLGTVGYFDPECNYRNRRASQRNDIYSFGVVMLEVVTGKKAIVTAKRAILGTTSFALLVDVAVPMINENDFGQIVDARPGVPQGLDWTAVYRVAHLARQCVRKTGHRPDISTIVPLLEHAFEMLNR